MRKLTLALAALFGLAGVACAQTPQPAQWRYSIPNGQSIATYPGDVVVNGQINPIPAGCDNTGATDATACLQAALNNFGTGGGTLKGVGKYLINSNLTIPVGVSLQGLCEMPGTPGSNSSVPYDNYTCGVFMVNSAATITMSSGSNISHALIYRAGMTFPPADSSAFAGTAITANGDDVSLSRVQVMGFNKGFYSSGFARARIDYFYGDNNNGIEIGNATDVPYLSHIHNWPFSNVGVGGSYTNIVRSGTAIYLHDVVDWAHLTDVFSYGYFRGIRLTNVNSTSIIAGGADNASNAGVPLYTNSIGLYIDGTSVDTRVYGFQSAAQATAGVYINTTGATLLRDTAIWGGSTHGVLIDAGDTQVQGGLFGSLNAIGNGVSINSTTARVTVNGVKFGTISGNPINMSAANTTTLVSNNDFGTYASQISSASMAAPSVASADPLPLPPSATFVNVTGTTSFGSVAYGWYGRCVTLKFAGVLTVFNGTASITSVRLASGGNFTTAANSTLTICHNGTQWYEISRSS